MNSLKECLQILLVVAVLGLVVFVAWYLLFYMPGRLAEPEGTLVWLPGKQWAA